LHAIVAEYLYTTLKLSKCSRLLRREKNTEEKCDQFVSQN
jgi:hypothetical protein